jgi:hypothetical protein
MERFLDAPTATAPWELDPAAKMLPQLKCVKDWLKFFFLEISNSTHQREDGEEAFSIH